MPTFVNAIRKRKPTLWAHYRDPPNLSKSVSSPLVDFGELNDNIIKGLISLLSVGQEIESIAYTCGLCINKYIQGLIS